jgi:hypothetical protein
MKIETSLAGNRAGVHGSGIGLQLQTLILVTVPAIVKHSAGLFRAPRACPVDVIRRRRVGPAAWL